MDVVVRDQYFDNMDLIHKHCEDSDDLSVQVLTNDRYDHPIYFKPINFDIDKFDYYDIFFSDRESAENINEIWNNLDTYDDLVQVFRETPFDSVVLKTFAIDGEPYLDIESTGNYRDDFNQKMNFAKEVVEFLNDGNIKQVSLNELNLTEQELN